MGQGYLEVAERLRAYRKTECKTQEEMGADMGVTQSHYAKLESGANVISYDCLKAFAESGGDVHFLITGERLPSGTLDGYMGRCATGEGKLRMHQLILWAVETGAALSGQRRELPEGAYRNLRLAQRETGRMDREPGKADRATGRTEREAGRTGRETGEARRETGGTERDTGRMWGETGETQREAGRMWGEASRAESVWRRIRKLDDITQVRMADILGISVKRYMRLENNHAKPDAEILYRLYSALSYTPELILRPSGHSMAVCNTVWETFSDEIRDRLIPLLEQAAELIGSSERGAET